MLTFQQVLDHFGGTHGKLAKALGIERAAVSMWDGKIPELRAYQIQVLTKGKLKVADLPVRRPTKRAA